MIVAILIIIIAIGLQITIAYLVIRKKRGKKRIEKSIEENRLELYFQKRQKALINGKVVPVKVLSVERALGWVCKDGIVYAVQILGDEGPTKEGLLMPALKNTEEQMKSDYKRLFGINIPEDVHQWPYKKEEG